VIYRLFGVNGISKIYPTGLHRAADADKHPMAPRL